MADIILIPEVVQEGGVLPADINKALINVQKQLDAISQLITTNYGTATVDGVVKAMKWKVLTGSSTGGTGSLTVAHGLDASKILTVTAQILYTVSGTYYYFQDTSGQFYTENNQADVTINGMSAAYYNMPYKITIGYTD